MYSRHASKAKAKRPASTASGRPGSKQPAAGGETDRGEARAWPQVSGGGRHGGCGEFQRRHVLVVALMCNRWARSQANGAGTRRVPATNFERSLLARAREETGCQPHFRVHFAPIFGRVARWPRLGRALAGCGGPHAQSRFRRIAGPSVLKMDRFSRHALINVPIDP